MVYSLNLLSSEGDATFSAQAGGPLQLPVGKTVGVFYNGVAVHDITGPTPFINLSTNVVRNSVGMAEVYETKITLIGKIVRTGNPGTMLLRGSGIGPVVSGINDLKNLLTSGDPGLFQVNCKISQTPFPLISLTGTRLVSLDFPTSSDNWIFTADYTAVLEYLEPAISGFYVMATNDSWNIEPLDDYVYSYGWLTVLQQSEYDNPHLKPTAATNSAPQPVATQSTNSTGGNSTANGSISYVSIPQFKISHNVSAVGIPSGTGYTGYDPYNGAYLNAKAWVENRLMLSFAGTSVNKTPGIVNLGLSKSSTTPSSSSPPPIASLLENGGQLYNHLRTTNFSITEGKYEVSDTWLAMPTGIGYTEDYSIDLSTDSQYIHTVRVQGEIKGLKLIPISVMSGGDPKMMSGQYDYTSISLKPSTEQATGAVNAKISDYATETSHITTIENNKYSNALSGWLYDVKPYLYRRACIGMNSIDRTKSYVPGISNPPKPPNNPIYSTHNPLNSIPISTSESHNTKRGSIGYTYEFNNKFSIISGALFSSISTDETGPTDIIGEAFVLGRALGPVLQNLGAKTSSKKTVTIEVGVVPPSSMQSCFLQSPYCPMWTGGTVYKTVTGLIEGLKPFGDRDTNIFGSVFARSNTQGQVYVSNDNQTWNPTDGRYTRIVTWIYQQCTNAKNYLDY